MVPFYAWSLTASRLQSHYEEAVYFAPLLKVPRNSWYSFSWCQKNERLSWPWICSYWGIASNFLFCFLLGFFCVAYCFSCFFPYLGGSGGISFFLKLSIVGSNDSFAPWGTIKTLSNKTVLLITLKPSCYSLQIKI